jgi:hypothetical protein
MEGCGKIMPRALTGNYLGDLVKYASLLKHFNTGLSTTIECNNCNIFRSNNMVVFYEFSPVKVNTKRCLYRLFNGCSSGMLCTTQKLKKLNKQKINEP